MFFCTHRNQFWEHSSNYFAQRWNYRFFSFKTFFDKIFWSIDWKWWDLKGTYFDSFEFSHRIRRRNYFLIGGSSISLMINWCFLDESLMFISGKIVSLIVEKHWEHGWSIDVASKSHQCLQCSKYNWCMIDIIDDNIDESSILSFCSRLGLLNFEKIQIQFFRTLNRESYTNLPPREKTGYA